MPEFDRQKVSSVCEEDFSGRTFLAFEFRILWAGKFEIFKFDLKIVISECFYSNWSSKFRESVFLSPCADCVNRRVASWQKVWLKCRFLIKNLISSSDIQIDIIQKWRSIVWDSFCKVYSVNFAPKYFRSNFELQSSSESEVWVNFFDWKQWNRPLKSGNRSFFNELWLLSNFGQLAAFSEDRSSDSDGQSLGKFVLRILLSFSRFLSRF